ncbi:hypothetical protein BT69DRAFT_1315754 [Atractiella rhizophila]|nr:hypothetical protein BT69DRAFT_1315754 [Atractiella rhizophila]
MWRPNLSRFRKSSESRHSRSISSAGISSTSIFSSSNANDSKTTPTSSADSVGAKSNGVTHEDSSKSEGAEELQTIATLPPTFPYELIREILSYLYDATKPSSLAPYSLISKAWLDPCRRFMFRELVVKSEVHGNSIINKFRHSSLRFFILGVKLPQIALAYHQFEQGGKLSFYLDFFATFPNVVAVDFLDANSPPDIGKLWYVLTKMVERSVDLQYLTISGLGTFSRQLEEVLEKFKRLRYISFGIRSRGLLDATGESYQFKDTSRFMSRITDLRLDGPNEIYRTSLVLLPPRLTRLYVRTLQPFPVSILAPAFVLLTHFYLNWGEYAPINDLAEQFSKCWEQANHLRAFAIAKDFLDLSILSGLPPTIQIMRLHFIRSFNERLQRYDLSPLDNLQKEADFPSLRFLHLTSGQVVNEDRLTIKHVFEAYGVEVKDGYSNHWRIEWPDWNF